MCALITVRPVAPEMYLLSFILFYVLASSTALMHSAPLTAIESLFCQNLFVNTFFLFLFFFCFYNFFLCVSPDILKICLWTFSENQIPHGFPTIDMGPQLKVVERTRTATMLCAASGNPDPEISWFKDMLPVDISSSNGRIKQLRSGTIWFDLISFQVKFDLIWFNFLKVVPYMTYW